MENILESLNYKLNERKLKDLRPFFSQDYRKANFTIPEDAIAYYGLEHYGKPKLLNVTVLKNLPTREGFVFGSSLGHQHTEYQRADNRIAQEVYEFLGDGGMLLRNEEDTRLYLLKEGEKVIVSPRDHMTIFNFGKEDLRVLDYSNPSRNSANKDLERKIGTFLLNQIQGDKFSSKFNSNYFSQGIMSKRLNGEVSFKWEDTLSFQDNFFVNYEDFKFEGITLVRGGNIPYYLRFLEKSLLDLVLSRNPELDSLLEM